tara:strand:- start:74 stop:469 length:396 start_codon:yes stop_codon:yes gene_type:complete
MAKDTKKTSPKVQKVSVFPTALKKASAKRKKEDDPAKDAKLRAFKASEVAERDGVALNEDGSIMRRAESLRSSSTSGGQTRAQYGVSKREPIYAHGFNSEKLRGAVANIDNRKNKASTKKKKKPTQKRGKK